MIELERHIEILLLSNDCVILPNFGGFMAHYVSAKYIDGENLFIPPSRTLGFNPQLTMNDSLLAQSYIEAYDISYPEAITRIDDEVRELKQRIETDGAYEMNDIGTIRLNTEGNYEFEPCEAGILTPSLYGFSSFEFRDWTSAPQTHIKEKKTSDNAKLINIEVNNFKEEHFEEETSSNHSSAFENTESEQENQKTISISINLLRNIAVACIAIIVFFLIPTPLDSNKNLSITKSKIDTGMLYKIMPKDVTSGKASIKINLKKTSNVPKSIQNDTDTNVLNNTHSVIKEDKKQSQSFYCIVLASRVTKTNAALFVDELHKNGYKEASVLPRDRGAKVIFGQYENEKEAYLMLNNIRKNKDFAEAWVMHVNMTK